MTRTAEDIRVQREAAFWFAVIETGEPSEADSERFKQWLAEHPANAQAYDEIAQIWRDSCKLTHLGALARPRRTRTGWFSATLRSQAAAVAAAAVAAIALVLILGRVFEPAIDKAYVTDIGEVREIALADGSEVTLGPKSRLGIAFGAEERRVTLSEGEAFFAVAPDGGRPFVVVADGTTIRVLGTRFNVHEGPRGLTVAVAEGMVEVATESASAEDSPAVPRAEERRRIGAGEKVMASPKGRLEPVERVSPDLPGAWREGRLVYHNATLAEVLADANRYLRTPIRIGAPELADLRVLATFGTADIERIVDDLEASLPLVVDRTIPGRVVLRSRPESAR